MKISFWTYRVGKGGNGIAICIPVVHLYNET